MKRYHALDSLRASMMLLGIWLHTVVGYSREGSWPYKDAHPTAVYDWTLGMIHTFRMPIFFVMAGFFGALLWERGRTRFLRNRLERILAPFLLFWTCLFPVVLWMAAYSRTWDHADGLKRATAFITTGGFLAYLGPLHLWFLEYLLALYAIAFATVTLFELAARTPWIAARFAPCNRWYRATIQTIWRPVIFAVPSAGALMLMRGGFLEDPLGFVPIPRIVIAYAIPFFFGWLLYRNRDLLDTFRSHGWEQIALAGALFGAWMAFVAPIQDRPEYWVWVKPLRATTGALAVWLLVFGMTGLFLRYYSQERPLARYLADASYWMYIMHMPVVMVLQMALALLRWPAAIKVPIVVALSLPILALSYDALVRSTWIGALLNGRRYDRWFVTRDQSLAYGKNGERPNVAALI
jgi:fucose 4-O-acetylase-like acetyltransferase